MQFSFSADQRDFAASLREMLSNEFATKQLREVWDTGTGHDPALWTRLADMGVLAMLLPESDGGLGGDFTDAVLLIEELGRAAVPGPVFETMTVGAKALTGTSFAAGIASGSVLVTAALLGEANVPHAGVSDIALLRDGDRVVAVERSAMQLTEVAAIDGGRRLSTVLRPTGPGTIVSLEHSAAVDTGALAAAAYLLGLSSQMLQIAGDYARERRQFGQPIGSFQAVKHLMADALLKVEFARPAIARAAWSMSVEHADRSRDVSMAKALAADAAAKAARSALQVHGAIGYTWECDLQLFMKKAWALIPSWGTTTFHRRRVSDAVLGRRS
jgi:alkylation response protein AidB-like acyl-CoA dehydrogenase